MDYISSINEAIDYIEANLVESIDIEAVAAAAGYSRFHFDRLFLALVGETPTRYIRKRRLTEAARALVVTKKRILAIALDHQFQSQAAFARAFRKLFGLSPGAYRKRGRLVRLCNRITLKQPQLLYLNHGFATGSPLVRAVLPAGKLLSVQAYIVLAQQGPRRLLRRTRDRTYLG